MAHTTPFGVKKEKGETYMPEQEEELGQTIDITPTPEGFTKMKSMFQAQLTSFEKDLETLLALDKALPYGGELFSALPSPSRALALLQDMIEEKQSALETSIEEFKAGITELEQKGY